MSILTSIINENYTTNINQDRYDEFNGSALIAMESMEEIHEMFIELSYKPDQERLKAIREGMDYEVVQENAFNNAIARIKEFLIKLRDKVLSFFKSMIRSFDSLIKSGKDFVTKYEKDIKASESNIDSDFKDSIKIYPFNDKAIDDEVPDTGVDISPKLVTSHIAVKSDVDKIKSELDNKYQSALNKLCNGSNIEDDELSKELYEYFRGGDSKDALDKSVNTIFSILKNTKTVDSFKRAQSKEEKRYNTMIKEIDSVGKSTQDAESDVKELSSEIITAYTSLISKVQTAVNTYYQVKKSVFSERDNAYKSVLLSAMKYKKKSN